MDPRIARSRAKIFEAVVAALAEHGYEAMTIEGVAASAGVAKTTIYRHWPSKARLVHDAVHDHRVELPTPDTGNLRDDLMAILGALVTRLATEPMRILPAMISAAEVDPELEALHRAFVGDRRRPLLTALERAIERGELPASVDVDLAADLLSGPLFFRRFITRQPVSTELVTRLVDILLPQLGTVGQPTDGRGGGRRRPRRGNMRHIPQRRTGSSDH